MIRRISALCAVVILLGVTWCSADYNCLCNYSVEKAVYPQPSSTSSPIGYMYEFDCKQIIGLQGSESTWMKVAFEHEVGYISIDSETEKQVCPGDPPDSDLLPPITTTSTQPPKTTPTTTTPTTTTTTMPTTMSTTLTTTHVPTTQTTPPRTPHTTPSTTPSTTSSPTTLPFTTRPTTTNVPTQSSLVIGNINLCPAKLHQYTTEDKGALTQYGDYCYELVPIRGIWERAERDCIYKGGYLIHISNQALQTYIYNWIKSYRFDHAVWIGLHDLWAEEHFEWISGDHVIWTNWYSDRLGNLASHHNEDCVLLVPYAPYFGKWDDVICGTETVFGTVGQSNPFICEFRIQHSAPLVG